jgi:hypothetical protein
LLQAISEFGLLLTFVWLVDAGRPFAKYIPPSLLIEFQRVSKAERIKGRTQRPSDIGELGFLMHEKSRMARALAVIEFAKTWTARHQEKDGTPPKGREVTRLPDLPLNLSSHIVVLNFGTFDSSPGRYPVGYVCRHLYFSVDNPSERCWYEASTELSDSGKLQYRIVSLDNRDRLYIADSPTGCWKKVLCDVESKRRNAKDPTKTCITVSGPAMYGFTDSLVTAAFVFMTAEK